MTTPVIRRRKKPIEVDTIQWTGDNEAELIAFTNHHFEAVPPEDRAENPEITAQVYDVLHSTWIGVYTGQHIVHGVKGEFYPIAEDVLAETYEAVSSAAAQSAPADRAAEEAYRLALSAALGLGTGANWEAIRDRAEDLTAQVGQLTEASRRLLEQRQEMAAERFAWQERGDRAEAAIERVRYLHDNLDAETALTSPDDEITRGAAARYIAASLDGYTPPAVASAVSSVGQAAHTARSAEWRAAAAFVEAMNEGCGQAKPCASCDAREDAAAELRRMADETQPAEARCGCPHPEGEHSVYGCADGCGCEWMPKRPPMDPVHILGIKADDETLRPAPAGPASTALRVRVLREVLARIDGGSEDSATEQVGAATVRAVLAEILTGMQQQPSAEVPSVVLADLYRELAEEAAEWGGVITEHEFRRKANSAEQQPTEA